MNDVIKEERWLAFRTLACWSVSDLQGQPILKLDHLVAVPKDSYGLYLTALSISEELDLANTIKKMDNALTHAADKLAYAHDVAAAVKVDAPTNDAVTALEVALRKVSANVAQDQKSKAAFKIIKNVADVLEDRLEDQLG